MLTKADLVKVGKGAALAGLGAGTVYALQGLDKLDFGTYDVLVASLISIALNLLRKLIKL